MIYIETHLLNFFYLTYLPLYIFKKNNFTIIITLSFSWCEVTKLTAKQKEVNLLELGIDHLIINISLGASP